MSFVNKKILKNILKNILFDIADQINKNCLHAFLSR
jgi:hypothetical protein